MLSQGPLPMGEVSGVTLGMLAPLDSFFLLPLIKTGMWVQRLEYKQPAWSMKWVGASLAYLS